MSEVNLDSGMHRLRYLGLLLPYVGLLATWDLAANLGATLFWFALALLLLGWARRWRPVPSTLAILVTAAALRLLLLLLPPTLSGDVLRYVWDGKVAGAGFNPYELAPAAPQLEPLRDDGWNDLDHRDVATVYPPLALTLFGLASRFPLPVLAWKLILIGADLVGCLVLCRIAVARGQGRGAALWYAWNPLVVLETAGMGHVDALGVCLVLVVVWALAVKRDAATAALAAAAAILAKLVPLIMIPAWLRQSGRPWLFGGLAAVVLGFAFAPVFVPAGGVPSGYVRFGSSWEFNGPIYEPLWRVFDAAGSRAIGESVLERLKERTGEHDYWNRFYLWNYPRMHARLLLAVLLAVLLIRAWRRQEPETATGLGFEAMLLCSATVYPWYLLWLLPFAALECRAAWLVLCGSAILAYVPQFTDIPLMPWIFLALWAPYASIRLVERRWSGS